MKRHRLPRFALAALAGLLVLTEPAAARVAAEINVFAWEVRPASDSPNQAPDLLLGTMHVGIAPGKRLPDAITSRLAQASKFAMEVDLSKIAPDMVARYVMLPPDQPSLEQQLPQASWRKLVDLAKAHGLPAEQVKRMAPWFVSMAFLDLETPGQALMDARLRAEADQAKVPVTFFETAEQQFQALSTIAPQENIGQLREVLDDPQRPKRELAQLEAAYRSGNLGQVQQLMFDQARIKAYPDFYRKVFWDRNARWEPKLQEMFAPGGAVVAVGLGHMLGEHGLVALLRHHGYRVTPLTL